MTKGDSRANASRLAQLMRRVADKDEVAFGRLYSLTAPKLFSLLLRMLREEAAAEEVLQDVFVKIWQQAGRYDESRARVTTWIATIARNRALDVIRGRREGVLTGLDLTLFRDETGSGPRQAADHDGMARELARCLEELDGEQRQTVLMAFYEGMTHNELAERMKTPLGTVKSWIRRSLMRLKECLDRGGHRETV